MSDSVLATAIPGPQQKYQGLNKSLKVAHRKASVKAGGRTISGTGWTLCETGCWTRRTTGLTQQGASYVLTVENLVSHADFSKCCFDSSCHCSTKICPTLLKSSTSTLCWILPPVVAMQLPPACCVTVPNVPTSSTKLGPFA